LFIIKPKNNTIITNKFQKPIAMFGTIGYNVNTVKEVVGENQP